MGQTREVRSKEGTEVWEPAATALTTSQVPHRQVSGLSGVGSAWPLQQSWPADAVVGWLASAHPQRQNVCGRPPRAKPTTSATCSNTRITRFLKCPPTKYTPPGLPRPVSLPTLTAPVVGGCIIVRSQADDVFRGLQCRHHLSARQKTTSPWCQLDRSISGPHSVRLPSAGTAPGPPAPSPDIPCSRAAATFPPPSP